MSNQDVHARANEAKVLGLADLAWPRLIGTITRWWLGWLHCAQLSHEEGTKTSVQYAYQSRLYPRVTRHLWGPFVRQNFSAEDQQVADLLMFPVAPEKR